MDNSVRLLLRYGGELHVDFDFSPTYTGGQLKVVCFEADLSFSAFKTKIIQILGYDSSRHDIIIWCKYKVGLEFKAVLLNDDEDYASMFSEAKRELLTVFVETKDIQSAVQNSNSCVNEFVVTLNSEISTDQTLNIESLGNRLCTNTQVQLFDLNKSIVGDVEHSDCNESWEWFLNRLREIVVPISSRLDLCIVSDKHPGLLRGVAISLPWATHRHCLRHLRENFKKAVRGYGIQAVDSLCEKMYWVGNTEDLSVYNQHMEDIKAVDKRAYDWLIERDVAKWTLLFDGGYRYGTMTTNASESFNGVLKRARGLPIQALVSATYYHCIGLFLKRSDDATAWEVEGLSPFVPKARVDLQSQERKARSLPPPVRINAVEFECNDYRGRRQRVVRESSKNATCTCYRMVIYHMPCAHAISTYASLRHGHEGLVSAYYTTKHYKQAYISLFHVIPDMLSWVPFDSTRGITELKPPMLTRRVGRPRIRRFKNSMDEPRDRIQRRCGACTQYGHNRATCPLNPSNQRRQGRH